MASPKQLDLGSGATPRQWEGFEAYGVDIFDYELPHVLVADLALEDIPAANDEFELVTAYDFLEHIPHFVYAIKETRGDWQYVKRNCQIELFNEVYRVLKDGGTFFFAVPMAGTTEFYRDPTHVYPWVQQSLHYFSGDYFGHHDDYQHTSKFELADYKVIDGWRLEATLKAIKPCGPPYLPGVVT